MLLKECKGHRVIVYQSCFADENEFFWEHEEGISKDPKAMFVWRKGYEGEYYYKGENAAMRIICVGDTEQEVIDYILEEMEEEIDLYVEEMPTNIAKLAKHY